MQTGFGVPVSGSWATPDNIRTVVTKAEALGYSSLWTFQRTLYPVGSPLPPPYRSVHDPLAMAAFVAGITERARIGLAVVNAPFYTPVMLAKPLASIDVLSGGRLDAGLGLGWSAEEFAAANVAMSRRGARTEEFVAALLAIWSQDPIEFHGEFYEVPPTHIAPLPAQRPHPPILMGGGADAALNRAGRIADGWISSSRFEASQVPHAVETLRAGAVEAGRDPEAVRIIIRAAMRVRDHDEDLAFSGTVDKIRKDFDIYAAAGVTEVFVDLNFDEEIGNPDADPKESMRRAHEALEAFAPPA